MRPQLHMRTRSEGFTLLEILIVVSILMLIMTASFGALSLGNRSFEAGISRANQTEQVRAIADLLRRQFSQLVPIIHEFDGETMSSFIGSDERIRFVAPAPQSGGDAGLFVYTISSQRADVGQNLALSYAPYDPGAQEFDYLPASGHKVLIESLASVRFDYYGAPNPGDSLDWRAEWITEDSAIPLAVRIAPLPEDETAAWPDLSFIIRAGGRQ